MESIDNQALVISLKDIVENFESEIAPFSEPLTRRLVGIFFRYCGSNH